MPRKSTDVMKLKAKAGKPTGTRLRQVAGRHSESLLARSRKEP